jgi:predicted nucleic acid-binding protein
VAAPLYVDTSAAVRAILESGVTPDVEAQLRSAPLLVTSRLTIVESSRVLLRLRALAEHEEAELADAEREIRELIARAEIWELSLKVCELARAVAPGLPLRTLDALHLATFVLARQQIEGLELLTTDDRLRRAAGVV